MSVFETLHRFYLGQSNPRMWLTRDYFPEIVDQGRPSAPPSKIQPAFGQVQIVSVPVPHDCTDGFLHAYWRRPEAYFDSRVRGGDFRIRQYPRNKRSCCAPSRLDDGTWLRRNGHLLQLTELDPAIGWDWNPLNRGLAQFASATSTTVMARQRLSAKAGSGPSERSQIHVASRLMLRSTTAVLRDAALRALLKMRQLCVSKHARRWVAAPDQVRGWPAMVTMELKSLAGAARACDSCPGS